MKRIKIKVESTTPEPAVTVQIRVVEAERETDREQDVRAVLEHIECAVAPSTTVEARLYGIVNGSRRELTATILTHSHSGYPGASGDPTGRCEALLYCLLNWDWGNFARVAEGAPDIKAGLSRILGITDQEWDELLRDEPLVDDPFIKSRDYVARLRASS